MAETIELPELEDRLGTIVTSAESRDLSFFLVGQLKNVEDLHQSYFASQAGPSGSAWEPWHWTPAWAPKDHPTLEITGALRNSLIAGAAGNVASVSGDELVFGTTIPYGPILNYGGQAVAMEPLVSRDGKGSIPAGTMLEIPAREFVGLNDEFVDRLASDLADELVNDMLKGL